MASDDKKLPVTIEGEVIRMKGDLPAPQQRSGTGHSFTVNFLEVLREKSDQRLFDQQAKTASSMRDVIEAVDQAARAKENLELTRERARHLDTMKQGVVAEIALKTTEAKRKLKKAEAKLEQAKARREAQDAELARRKRDAESDLRTPEPEPDTNTSEPTVSFYDAIHTGVMGKHQQQAERDITRWLKDQGFASEADADEEAKSRIAKVRQMAAKMDESKG